jgi:general secretion pathway protein G
MKTNSARSGFTLIEMMVVVIILAALAAMIIPHVVPASDDAKKKIALAEIKGIETALKMYRLHNSRYPGSDEGLGILMKPSPQWSNEPYLEDDKDPWGNSFKYASPGTHGSLAGYEIWSVGPDGKDGSDDDVVSWKPK